MRKLVLGLMIVAAFAVGMSVGLDAQTADADDLCWAYCDKNDIVVQCCPGVGCWVTGIPCPF